MMSDILPVQLTPAVDNVVISIPSTLSLWVTLLCLFYGWEVTTGRFGTDLRQGSVGRKQDLSTTWEQPHATPVSLELSTENSAPDSAKRVGGTKTEGHPSEWPFPFRC